MLLYALTIFLSAFSLISGAAHHRQDHPALVWRVVGRVDHLHAVLPIRPLSGLSGNGRRAPGARVGAAAAIRSAGHGCVFRRLGAGSPGHARSVPQLFSASEARRYCGCELLQQLSESKTRHGGSRGVGAMLYEFTPDDDLICFSCSWVLLMAPATAAAHIELRKEGELLKPQPGFRIWTDDFSNLYGILM